MSIDLKSLQSAMSTGNHQEIASILGIDIGDTDGMLDRIGELEREKDELVKKVKYLNGELPKWTPASKPPQDDRYVLVYIPNDSPSLSIGYHGVMGDVWLNDGGFSQIFPTHWMPLSDEPEGDN